MDSSTKRFFQRKSIRNFLIALLFFASLFFILLTSLKPEKFDLRIGQKAPENIQAPKDIEDKINTDRAKQKAAAAVKPIYKLNPGVHVEVK